MTNRQAGIILMLMTLAVQGCQYGLHVHYRDKPPQKVRIF